MMVVTDSCTGEQYDADKWYRGSMGIWHNVEAENRYKEAIESSTKQRRSIRNKNRVKRGKRRKSKAEFDRSTRRYDEYLREDSGYSFGEWLKCLKYRRRL